MKHAHVNHYILISTTLIFRILVLDKGLVKEFDSPENLLKDKNNIFYSLAKSAGVLDKLSE